MSDLEKLFEAIGNRTVTIYRRDVWHVELSIRDYPIQAEGASLALAAKAAMLLVLDHAQTSERELEDASRGARDRVARLRTILGVGL